MAGHKNTFIKGMNQDISKQKYPQDQYKNSRDLRPITDKGLSTGAMENIKGNIPQVNFPALNGFLEIVPSEKAYEDSGTENSETVIIMLNPATGPTPAPYSTNIVVGLYPFLGDGIFNTPQEYLDNIEQAVRDYNNTLPADLKFIIHRSNTSDRLIIESPIHPLSHTTNLGNSSLSEYGVFKVINSQKNFTVIGSTNLRDKIILFTVNDTSTAEDAINLGQIWTLEYSVEFPITDRKLTLIYYGELNFSLDHPIEAVGNYENIEKQLVYFTDNFSPPRRIDIVNPNSFTLFPDELLLNNKAQLYPALAGLEEQNGGALPTGILYLTYKLEKFGGSTTVTAPISSAIPITNDDMISGGVDTNVENINYPLTTVGSNKSLNYLIPNIPKGFDKIYVFAIYEKDPDNYIAYRVEEQLLSNDPSFEFTLSSLGDKQIIPLVDLFTYDIDFERVKTMAVKDNQLLFGNIKQAAFNLDFDARAYRFKLGSTDTYVSTPGITIAQKNWGVDLEKDVINPHNDDRTDDNPGVPNQPGGYRPYRYQYNSGVMGGEGPNIKYRFISRELILDQSGEAAPSNETFNQGPGYIPITTPADQWLGSGLYPSRTPFVNSKIESSLDYSIRGRVDDPIPIDFGPGFKNYKNNRIEATFKGYMKDEIYRFGIIFYSPTGRPSEVKWIGDIRMPCDGDVYSVDGNSRHSVEFHSEVGTAMSPANIPKSNSNFRKNATIGSNLGIRFDVDVSSIADKISGYSIVRAPRKEKDRTIIAQGALNRVMKVEVTDPDSATTLDPNPVRFPLANYTDVIDGFGITAVAGIKAGLGMDFGQTTVIQTAKGFATFDSPDLKFISGARVNDYVNTDEKDFIDSYYFKPVAGYSQVCDINSQSVNNVVPVIIGNIIVEPSVPTLDFYLNRYTKSLANCNTVSRHDRRKFSIENGPGYVNNILKIGANQIKIEMAGQEFDNRGFLSNLDVTPTVPEAPLNLLSPGCQTILVSSAKGTDAGRLSIDLYNQCFGKIIGSLDQDSLWNGGVYGNYGNYKFTTADVSRKGATAIVDLCRVLDRQYGGATYNDVLNTEYISTGHYAKVDPEDVNVGAEVYGGDIYIAAFDEKKLYSYARRDATTGNRAPGTDTDLIVTPLIGKIYPICSIINTDMRVGFHLNNLIQGPGGDIDLREEKQDEYLIPIMYHREKTLQKYLITGEGANLIGEYDTRIYISQPKTSGEFSDSWSSIKPFNYKDVDGEYGPINKLAILNDNAMWWQDKGFGKLAVNPRAIVQSLDGAELEMGTGRNLTDYTYISNSIGAFHQWGVISGSVAIYWFDAVHRKFCRFSNKLEVLSNSKFMSSFFNNTIVDSLLTTDNPIRFNGVTGTYDYKFNEVIMTFHSNQRIRFITDPKTDTDIILEPNPFKETIVFNENIDAFSSFYDHFPRHYINDGRKIFSQNDTVINNDAAVEKSSIQDTIYIHDHSERSTFYGEYFSCKLDLVINPKGDHTKVFNNLEFFTEVENADGLDVFNETLTQARYFNEYQDTEAITLIPDENVQRRMRTWRTIIPRDTSGTNSRLRNPNIQLELEFTKSDDEDKRLVIHDIITHYMDVPM